MFLRFVHPLIISLIVVVNFFNIESVLSYEFSDDSKIQLIKSLKDEFLESNLNNAIDRENLILFQNKLIKVRNAQHLLREQGTVESAEINLIDYVGLNDTKWNNIMSLWSNFSSAGSQDVSIRQEIIQSLNQLCIDAGTLIDYFYLNNFNETQNFVNIFDIILTQLTNSGCDLSQIEGEVEPTAAWEVWLISLIFVTVICLASQGGALVVPFRNHKNYKKILMYMIGLAVGTLASSGMLHLIPQAYGITEDGQYAVDHKYLWYSVVMMFGVYMFYLVEKMMNLISFVRQKAKIGQELEETDKEKEEKKHGHSHGEISPVAWMVIFSDGLHNFIDGLSIGAAFTKSILSGISISLAILCEEFPHELGDFAILVNGGFSIKRALFLNFVSASTTYVGLIFGILLGENLNASQWVFALAGGMFIYIGLCSMIPELEDLGEEIEEEYLKEQSDLGNVEPNLAIKLKILFIQNSGILTGFTLMLVLAVYSKDIKI